MVFHECSCIGLRHIGIGAMNGGVVCTMGGGFNSSGHVPSKKEFFVEKFVFRSALGLICYFSSDL